MLILIQKDTTFINPILPGGGHYGPYDRRSSAVSLWIALGSPNFLTLFLLTFYKSQKSRFLKKNFLQKISKVVKNIHRGDPSMQKSKFSKNFFFWKYYLFCLNINCTWSQLHFEVHSSSLAQNFKFLSFFPWNFQFWPSLLAWP